MAVFTVIAFMASFVPAPLPYLLAFLWVGGLAFCECNKNKWPSFLRTSLLVGLVRIPRVHSPDTFSGYTLFRG